MDSEMVLSSVIDEDLDYRRVRDIRAEKMDDNLFLIDQLNQTIDMLDPMGALIWELLADPISVSEVTGLISAAFPDANPDQIRSDIRSLYETFKSNEWIMVNSEIK